MSIESVPLGTIFAQTLPYREMLTVESEQPSVARSLMISLLGSKIVLNELIAYLDLVNLAPGALSGHSRLIMTYALCGFANFGSLGIMLGGLGAMAPERRGEIVALGLRSIAAGALASFMTAAVAGMIL